MELQELKKVGLVLLAVLLLFVVALAVSWSGVLYLPAPDEDNIFDEIYGSAYEGDDRRTAPKAERFSITDAFDGEYDGSTFSVMRCRCNLDSYTRDPRYPGLKTGDQMYVAVDSDARTVIFTYQYASTENTSEAVSTYTYSFKKKRLTYTSTNTSETEPNRFLFDLLLPAWIDNTEGISDFSYDDWGDYQFVIAD